MTNCYEEKTGRTDWRGDWDAASEYESVMAVIESLTNEKISIWMIECIALIIATYTLQPLFSVAVGIGLDAFLDRIGENQNKSISELKQRKNELLASRQWLKDLRTRYDAYHAIGDCYDKCKKLTTTGGWYLTIFKDWIGYKYV